MMIEKQKDVIEVTRYIRPDMVLDDNPYCLVDYAGRSNLYGVTVVYVVNYLTRKVEARWSICNGDNFNKYQGKVIARHSPIVVEFDLSDVNDYGSLNEALIEKLTELTEDWYVSDFEDTLKLFLKASRKLKKIKQ